MLPSDRRLTPKAVLFYRVLAVTGAALIVLFGWVHRTADPAAFDPLAERLAVAAACLAVFALSFVLRDRAFLRCVYAAYYLVTAWVIHLLAVNGFAHEYAIALLVVASAIASSFHDIRQLAAYLLATIGGVALVAARVEQPETDLLVYLSYAGILGVLSFIIVGARVWLEGERRASEERYALAAYGANDGLWDWDMETGRIHFSARWKEMLGYLPAEIGTDPAEWLGRIHPDDRDRVRRTFAPTAAASDPHLQAEYRIRNRDGAWLWMLARAAAVYGPDGTPVRIVGSQSDITAHRHAEEALLHSALHDRITDLPNRALLLDRLERRLLQAERMPEVPFALLYLDIARFKFVTDSMGPAAGDTLLLEIVRRFKAEIGPEDTLARIGNHEFAVLMPDNADADRAVRKGRRLQAVLERPIRLQGQDIFVQAHVGIALGPAGYSDPEALLRDADIAMYRATQSNSGEPQLFDETMYREAVDQLRLANELRNAVGRGELVLYYQPIIRLDTDRIAGFEALVRWNHPERGLLLPTEFIPLAEETGLIRDIESWVLSQACRASRHWRSNGSGPLVTSVNLSVSRFTRGDLVEDVDAILRDAKADPRGLALEVTESALMADPEAASEMLMDLRRRGISISIDDFGTGYSSLSYLQRLPADTLKIDRSFVSGIDRDEHDAELVATIVTLASSLGMSTTAEGVERAEQLARLRSLGAGYGQGFYFSGPVTAPSAHDLLFVPHGA